MAFGAGVSALGPGCKLRHGRAAVDLLSSGFVAAWRAAGKRCRMACRPGDLCAARTAAGREQYVSAGSGMGSPDAAAFAGCLYIANPYAMFVAYERSALGELLASAWLPLVVLFALRRRSSIAPLGLSVAALWLTRFSRRSDRRLYVGGACPGDVDRGRQPWPARRAAAEWL